MVGLLALISARAVNAATRLAVTPSARELAGTPPSVASLPAGAPVDASPILARNPFDGRGPLLRPGTVPSAAEAIAETDLDAAPPCPDVRLLVAVAATTPEDSLASFQAEGGKSFLRRSGQDVAGKRIEYIGWDRAFLSSAGSLCQTQLFVPPSPSAAPPPPMASGVIDPTVAQGIRQLGPAEFEIDRSLLDRVIENPADLLKAIRVAPSKEGDSAQGLRLLGIKTGSVLGLLGVQNGDRLQKINGFDVTSPEKALEAYARLRAGADRLTLQINRGEKPMNLDYRVK